jgi:hypothetical protein
MADMMLARPLISLLAASAVAASLHEDSVPCEPEIRMDDVGRQRCKLCPENVFRSDITGNAAYTCQV